MPLTPFARRLIEAHLMVYPSSTIKVENKTFREEQFLKAVDGYKRQELWPALKQLEYKPERAKAFEDEWSQLAIALAECTSGDAFKDLLANVETYLQRVNQELLGLAEAQEGAKLSYLKGEYTSTEHTTRLVALADRALVYDHKNKHFRGVAGADAQYNKPKGYVAALEAKAVRLGLPMKGDIYFLHNEPVGWLGNRHGNAPSACIRVDAPDGETQHSHPFPESLSSSSDDTHDSLLADLVVDCAKTGDMDYLSRIAKYLADVGGHVIALNSAQKREVKDMLPACPYWR